MELQADWQQLQKQKASQLFLVSFTSAALLASGLPVSGLLVSVLPDSDLLDSDLPASTVFTSSAAKAPVKALGLIH